jgi:p-aminobenzoyl-glutamate transporter AbgT
MAKRRRRRSRAKRKRPSLILIVALLVLAAGFITRRVLAPRAMHFLTHRSPTTLPATTDNGASERLTDSDRRALDQLVRQKSGR